MSVGIDLAALKARDPAALAALVDDNLPRLLNGALGTGLSRVDAEDAVSETFAAFLGQLERFEGRSSLSTPAQGAGGGGLGFGGQASHSRLLREAPGGAKDGLLPQRKEVEGVETGEVCNILGVTGTNLRVMLHRARLRLRECLERAWEAGS